MRQITSLSFALICLVSLGCSAQPTVVPTRVPSKSGKIRYFHLLNMDMRYVPTLMAMDALQAEGYVVERISLTTSALLADALARGDADIASFNNQTMWTAISKGARARTFFQGIGSSGYIVAKQELKSCQELDGRQIGMPATTGLSPTLLDLFMKQNCPNSKPKFLLITDSPGREAALIAGQIDAGSFQLEETMDVQRKAPGKFYVLSDQSKDFPQIVVQGLQWRQEWAAQNPEMAKDFIRALLEAHRRVNENPQLLYDEGVRRLGLDPAIAKQVGDACLKSGMFDPNGGLMRGTIQSTLDLLANIQAIPAGLKPEDISDLSYLNAVLDEIGRK